MWKLGQGKRGKEKSRQHLRPTSHFTAKEIEARTGETLPPRSVCDPVHPCQHFLLDSLSPTYVHMHICTHTYTHTPCFPREDHSCPAIVPLKPSFQIPTGPSPADSLPKARLILHPHILPFTLISTYSSLAPSWRTTPLPAPSSFLSLSILYALCLSLPVVGAPSILVTLWVMASLTLLHSPQTLAPFHLLPLLCA